MHKILSYLLLCAGILIILFALNSMYNVFINGQTVREIVHFADMTIQTQVGPMNVPMGAANTLANMGLFAVLMTFVMAVGGKIASLGVQLLKNERIYDALMRLNKENLNATQLAQEAAAKPFDVVVAMGGDGTINETAQGLVNTSTALGIIPRGSGNGFARELHLMGPLEKVLAKLQHAQIQPCDVGYANGELFLNLAGVGIEAAIAWQFMDHGKTGKRGMLPYFTLGAKTFFNYQPNELRVTFNGQTQRMTPLTLVFANNRQYGSNFVIAPEASICDGALDMVQVHNISKCKLALGLSSFLRGKKPPFGVTSYTRVQQALIESDREILYHIDGEPRKADHRLEIKLTPHALKLWVP